MSGYFDYRFRFPIAGLALALRALAALRTAGLLGSGLLPENMLGDPRDDTGSVSASPTWAGRPGAAAISYPDRDTGAILTSPARGDPDYYYIHIRSTVDPTGLPLDPAAYGLTPSDPTESAEVLSEWA